MPRSERRANAGANRTTVLRRARIRLNRRAQLERTFRAATSIEDDSITLRFQFKGGDARLLELRDNETDIYIADAEGPWQYLARRDDLHVIEWHLFAPGQTLTDLKAFASKNGGKEKLIAQTDKSEGGWIAAGDLL